MRPKARGKLLNIFLPDGNPQGIKIASLSGRTASALFFPRNLYQDVQPRLGEIGVGTYLLFGPSEDEPEMRVYVGETEDLLQRLDSHQKTKEFWSYSIVLFSSSKEFTKSHVKYLEHYFLNKLKDQSECRIVNQQETSLPHTPEAIEQVLLENIDCLELLCSALGFHYFEPSVIPDKTNRLICIGPEATGYGLYLENGFKLLKGSQLRKQAAPSAPGFVSKTIAEMLTKKLLEDRGKSYILLEDYLFRTPSGASNLVLARNSNGWDEWVHEKSGLSLNQTLRDTKTKG